MCGRRPYTSQSSITAFSAIQCRKPSTSRRASSPARQAAAVYILGDLFEVWTGDDTGLADYADEARRLRALTAAGVPVYFQHGNRDFLVGQRFFRETGVQPLPDPDVIQLDGRTFLISHGDLLCTGLFCRQNGHGTDLNRQGPTSGWQDPTRNVVGEPESIGYYNWMLDQGITWSYAIDIHGMLNHQNFGAIMLPAGAMTPQEMQRSIRLAETLKDRLNTDPHFDGWRNVFGAGETVEVLEVPSAGEQAHLDHLGETAAELALGERIEPVEV